jgi:hypothetical protein
MRSSEGVRASWKHRLPDKVDNLVDPAACWFATKGDFHRHLRRGFRVSHDSLNLSLQEGVQLITLVVKWGLTDLEFAFHFHRIIN